MKRLNPLNMSYLFATIAVILLVLPVFSAHAGDKPFPHKAPALYGSLPEGFAIGRGHTAFNGSVDGSIYKINLRSGEGETLVEPEPGFPLENDCYKLGMRVDPRTNYLFVAGCVGGNAYVFDADNGALVMEYQLPLPPALEGGFQIINDLAITKDAVYFTDSHQPLIYKLPLSRNGGLPASADDIMAIELTGDFVNIPPEHGCCGANGIVATPNGKTLIVGLSNFSQLFKVDPSTGHAIEIEVNSPLIGFLDGLVMRGRTVYVLSPGLLPEDDMVQVVTLATDMLSGELSGIIRDSGMDGVASGALFGNSLYVNNARYTTWPPAEQWVTKLNIHAVE